MTNEQTKQVLKGLRDAAGARGAMGTVALVNAAFTLNHRRYFKRALAVVLESGFTPCSSSCSSSCAGHFTNAAALS